MAQTENKGIHRLNRHKDSIILHNPDQQVSFENRNKQLRKIFEACGYQIGGITVSPGDMLIIKFGKHYTFRALSTDRYIILLDSYDYKASKIKVQLVTDTNLNIGKIKPKIEALMKNIMERLSVLVTREEHKERDEILMNAILEEMGGTKAGYNGWNDSGKNHDHMSFSYNESIDELRNDNTYHEEGEKRSMGIRIVMKIERYPTEMDNYDIKSINTPIVYLSGGSSLCLNDDIEFHNGDFMELTIMERMAAVKERNEILMSHAIVMKKALMVKLMELENYEMKDQVSPKKED